MSSSIFDHYSTDPEWSPSPSTSHPITRQLALSFFPGISGDQPGAAGRPASTLAALSAAAPKSYTRPCRPVAERELEGASARTPVGARPGRQVLAVAAEGTWPQSTAGAPPFRLIVTGDGDFHQQLVPAL